MAIRQAFHEKGALPVCASCHAEFAMVDGDLVIEHTDTCSQAGSIAAQWQHRLTKSRLSALS